MMEIIFHKCEFVGEMAVVQQAQRDLCLESYDRIEQVLTELHAGQNASCHITHPPGGDLMRSYISGLMENWLFAPESFDLRSEARSYVDIFLEMCQLCPTLQSKLTLLCLIGHGKNP